MTLVSFVIPNFNHAAYLGDAIRSALAQTHAPVEIVVVDDGSTDNSREVAQQFGAQIRLICQENAGLSAARNTGIRAATGEYIALLDADDLVEPAYAERLLALLAASPGADGAYCGFRFVDQHNRPLPRAERRVVEPAQLYNALLRGNYWVPESLIIRRECYLADGEFDITLRASEDWDVWLRFSRKYCLVGTLDELVRYRVVVGSMSSNPRRMLDNRLRVLTKHLGEQPQHAGTSAAHQAFANVWLRGAIEYMHAGDEQASYDCLRAAVRLQPQLLNERRLYYELACSRQERGSQGDVTQLAVAQQQPLLFDFIARLAAEPALAPFRSDAPAWQAQAMWTLAQLHYGAGEGAAARAAWMQAGKLDPSLLRRRAFLSFGARVLLGPGFAASLKRGGRRRGKSQQS